LEVPTTTTDRCITFKINEKTLNRKDNSYCAETQKPNATIPNNSVEMPGIQTIPKVMAFTKLVTLW
jgi:hypothetical protein